MRKGRFWIILPMIFLLIPKGHSAQAKISFKTLDQDIPKALEAWQVPGLALAVVKDGTVVWTKGYGIRDIEKKTPADERTIFGCGSTTKAFTAALVGVLVHEGRIGWDDKVIDHLPDFRMSDPYVTAEMTVRDLLCHRSGLPVVDLLWHGSLTRDEIVRRIRFIQPSSSFRSKFSYQNLMILTAGQLVARVTGKSWDENVREKIFAPLGMTRSSTSIRDLRREDNVATPHGLVNEKLSPIPWLDIDNIGPAGSINSAAVDYAKWIQLHLGKGTFQGKTLWSEDIQRVMHSPHSIISGTTTGITHFNLYGLGWFLNDYRGRLLVWHGGATDGMGAIVGMLPEENLGVAILCNALYSSLLSNLMYRIFDINLGVPEREWKKLDPQPPSAPPLKKPELSLPEDTKPSFPLSRYAGTYASPLYGQVRVVLMEGKLALNFDSFPPAALEHKYLDTFRAFLSPDISYMVKQYAGRGLDVTFTIDAGAKITEMNIDIYGTFKRKSE